MKTALIWLLLASPLLGRVTVSNIQFLYGSHSSVTVQFDVSAVSNAFRVRYVPVSRGSCDNSSRSATLETFRFTNLKFTSGIQLPISGLAANTKYEFCPEASSDGGKTWSKTGAGNPSGATFTTLPLPAVHPALPIHPATFDTGYPDTKKGACWRTGRPGYCTVVENTCAKVPGDIAAAVSHQKTSGAVIEIPAGTTCTNEMNWSALPPDGIKYNPSSVANNTIALANHGLKEGQGAVFESINSDYSGYYPSMPRGLTSGYIYFVHVVDANHFQLYENWEQQTGSEANGSSVVTVPGTYGYASSPGISVGEEIVGPGIPAGTTITAISADGQHLTLSASATATANNVTFTFGGPIRPIAPCSGGSCAWHNSLSYFVPWPRRIPYWVIVRTSTPDSQFAPPGTRINPSWASKMVTFESTTSTDPHHRNQILFDAAAYATHIRFTGIEWTWQPTAEVASDPISHENLINVPDYDSNIIFDRDWFHAPDGIDDRVHQMIFLNGIDVAIIDSYWDNLTYWHASYSWPGKSGVPTQSSQTPKGTAGGTSFTISPATVYYGARGPGTLSTPLKISWTGAPDPSIKEPEISVYFDMAGALEIKAPQGLSVTASAGTVSYTTASGKGSCTEGDPMIPLDAQRREAAAPLGCALLNANGQISGSLKAGRIYWGTDTEGCQCFIGGVGPGPYQVSNNYIEGSGLIVHFDNSGGLRWRGDYLIRRNTFHIPIQDLDTAGNRYARDAGVPSNGYWYANRQVLEWKGGEREWIDGNIFDGGFADVNHASPFDVTAHSGDSYGITDMDVTNNTVKHYPMAMGTIVNVMDNNGRNPPFTDLRFRAYNNLGWDINGWIYSTSDWVGWGVGAIGEGSFISAAGGPGEDFIFDHNTVYDLNGMSAQLLDLHNGPVEGVRITNNILPYSRAATGQDFFMQAGAPLDTAACAHSNGANESGTDCSFIAGVGHPDMVFKGNLIVPGWARSQYPAGDRISLSEMHGEWPHYVSQNTWLRHNKGGARASFALIGWPGYKPGPLYDSHGNYIGPKPDFHVHPDAQTTDGKPAGADIGALEVAQGKVTLIGAERVTNSSADIKYVAPDSFSCSVDYGSADPALIRSFTRVQDSGGTRTRTVTLSHLSPHTEYRYRVNCAVQQPVGKFRTN